MKQNAQWLSQVRSGSNSAECTSTPERLAGRAWRRSTVRSSPPRCDLELEVGVVGEQPPPDHVARRLAVDGRRPRRPTARPARGGRRPGRDGDDPGRDMAVQATGRGASVASIRVPVDQVLLAAPRGFCAGVEMAIKALAWMVRAFEPPVYCYHEIVHNQLVVDRFEQLGVVFVDDIAEVPEGRPIMLSAHGSAPEVVAGARARGSVVVNAVCPLVTKVHHEVKRRAGKGYRIVYVGHEGHEEAVGTMAVAPDAIHLVETVDDVAALARRRRARRPARPDHARRTASGPASPTPPASRFPDLWEPGRSDLCFATTNRQSALMAHRRRGATPSS